MISLNQDKDKIILKDFPMNDLKYIQFQAPLLRSKWGQI
jgi:hypothetical protein